MKTNHDDPYKMGYRRVTMLLTILFHISYIRYYNWNYLNNNI